MGRDGKARPRPARGGLLLETLLALVILVMIGTLALGVARDAIKATERADRRAAAVELAATRMAEIEAGLIDPDSVGDLEDSPSEDDRPGPDAPRWRFMVAVETAPSAFDGLLRIEVVVREEDEEGSEAVELARLVSLVEEATGTDRDR
ncbi:MAG: hypothetical protein GY895_07405 [Phycisphaera sp.]|nr:hypothetical protein [Phycisphaera sp.]